LGKVTCQGPRRQGNLEPVIFGSARKHGVADEDMRHAYNHPIRAYDLESGKTMLIGPDRAGNLLEVGVVTEHDGPVIIHAMRARPKFLRRR
jgi:hypothetical protein